MRRSLTTLLLATALALVVSCGGSGGGGGTSGNMLGTWSGTWNSTAGQGSGALVVTLNQSGTTITGKGYIIVEGVKYDGTGSGTITDPNGPGTITFGLAFAVTGQSAALKGSYTATTITGTYVMSDGDKGTFSLTKQ